MHFRHLLIGDFGTLRVDNWSESALLHLITLFFSLQRGKLACALPDLAFEIVVVAIRLVKRSALGRRRGSVDPWCVIKFTMLLLLEVLAVASTDIVFTIEEEGHEGQMHLNQVRMIDRKWEWL